MVRFSLAVLRSIAVLAASLALLWTCVHFLRFSPDLLYLAPAIAFVYLALDLLWPSTSRRRAR
jgi:hypothetical protein